MDIKDWCRDHLKNTHFKGTECVATCPFCGVDNRQFSVNTETGKYQCLRNSCNIRSNQIVFLISYCEGIKPYEAREKYSIRRYDKETENLIKYASFFKKEVIDADSIKLPEYYSEFVGKKDQARYLNYLLERNITNSTIEDFKIGYCNGGDYMGRIIIPINTNNFKAFTSRTISSKEELRYKNEPGAWKSNCLLGFNESVSLLYKQKAKQLFIVEGPFDVLSLYSKGFPAVCLQGTQITKQQSQLIKDNIHESIKIVLILDHGVSNKKIDTQCSTLYTYGVRNLFTTKLNSKDAGDAATTKQDINMALVSAKKWN